MYPVSNAFLQSVQENTRSYYWTGKITTTGGVVYEFGYEDICSHVSDAATGFLSGGIAGWRNNALSVSAQESESCDTIKPVTEPTQSNEQPIEAGKQEQMEPEENEFLDYSFGV